MRDVAQEACFPVSAMGAAGACLLLSRGHTRAFLLRISLAEAHSQDPGVVALQCVDSRHPLHRAAAEVTVTCAPDARLRRSHSPTSRPAGQPDSPPVRGGGEEPSRAPLDARGRSIGVAHRERQRRAPAAWPARRAHDPVQPPADAPDRSSPAHVRRPSPSPASCTKR